jgi:hypothetical protein
MDNLKKSAIASLTYKVDPFATPWRNLIFKVEIQETNGSFLYKLLHYRSSNFVYPA